MEREIVILHVPRFMKASKQASIQIFEMNFDAIFFPLPEEIGKSLKDLLVGDIEEDELWYDYKCATRASEPMVRFLKRFLSPILNALKTKIKLSKFDVYCYDEAAKHAENASLSERQLYLEFKCRATGRLFLDEWRRIIEECTEREAENYRKLIVLLRRCSKPLVVTHDVSVKPLRNALKNALEGRKIKVSYTFSYWRLPLEQLLMRAMIFGVDAISPDDFMILVKKHLEFIDYILLEGSLDEAYEKWVMKELSPSKRKDA